MTFIFYKLTAVLLLVEQMSCAGLAGKNIYLTAWSLWVDGRICWFITWTKWREWFPKSELLLFSAHPIFMNMWKMFFSLIKIPVTVLMLGTFRQSKHDWYDPQGLSLGLRLPKACSLKSWLVMISECESLSSIAKIRGSQLVLSQLQSLKSEDSTTLSKQDAL